MTRRGYREIDHTGDLGFETEGTDPADLFARAGLALADLLYDPDRVRLQEEIGITLRGADRVDLLVLFLGEILYLFEVAGIQFREFSLLQAGEDRLRVVGRGERFRPDRHRVRNSVKAVTYHQARFERRADGRWRARVILDV